MNKVNKSPPPSPQTSPLFRLPPEIWNIIYTNVLQGTEQPLYYIRHNEVWRCGPNEAFKRPGPPSLIRVCRLIAEEASQVLHEVRELRVMVISQGLPTAAIACDHKFCTLDEFVPILKRIQTLTLVINTHPGFRLDTPYMQLLDSVCTFLEQRSVPIRNLGLILECCFGDKRISCTGDQFDLGRRFQALHPTYVEHWPWNAKCTWAKVKQTKGRYRRAAMTMKNGLLVPMQQGGNPIDVLTGCADFHHRRMSNR